MGKSSGNGSGSRIERIVEKGKSIWEYVSDGVWRDTRHTLCVNVIKTLNLSIRSFMNSDMQTQACAMTYRTLLAIVPALALLFAIGRGFGFQNMLQDELFHVFPAQRQAVSYALGFVDSYISSSSEGIFVGVGLVVLLWTMISLFGNIEDTFNIIWGVQGRSFGRKITDYTAMLLILPVVLICAGGMSLLLSTSLQSIFHWKFMSPVITCVIEGSSWLLTWLFFALLYLLMPNTKVKFSNAFMAGVMAGTGFRILQWLFVTGQMYVSRYNAIYGSFSFLPLLLLWMQLTWVIVFAGGVVCYSSQNIFMYNFNNAIRSMSSSFYARLTLALCALVVQNFVKGKGATLMEDMVKRYNLPPKLGTLICDRLVQAGVLSVVEVLPKGEIRGYQPALDPSQITVALVYDRLDRQGTADFIQGFDDNFPGVVETYKRIHAAEESLTSQMLLSDIKINF